MTMNILNIKVNNINTKNALDCCFAALKQRKKIDVFFLNADCLRISVKDEDYRRILNNVELVLPDGIGLKIVAKYYGYPNIYNTNGTDFSPVLVEEAAKRGYKIFLLGAKDGIAQKAAENMCKQVPLLNIVGTHSGYFDDDNKIIEIINASGADILFIAMGAPLQEKWIAKNRDKLNAGICLGIGALFDYLSGSILRAPKWMIALNLEWLWRVFVEPKRMFKRYFIDGIGFMFWLFIFAKRRL